MNSSRSQLIELIEQGAIPAGKIDDALIATKIAPDGKAWHAFIDRLLLWLGGLALAFAVMFFVAYNWNDIGRFAKFGMVEIVIVLAIAAYCRFTEFPSGNEIFCSESRRSKNLTAGICAIFRGLNSESNEESGQKSRFRTETGERSAAGKVALLVATICLGVLQALYGQTYQTGADPWQLFFTWALLMLPWALIGRFPALWIVWVVLMDTSIVLYYQTFQGLFWFMAGSETGMLWLLFILNTVIFAAWEFLAGRWQWLSARWAIRLLATGSGVPLVVLILDAIFGHDDGGVLPGIAWASWAIWLATLYVVYRRIKPDLFMLAGCCLSGITVVVSLLGKHLLKESSAGSFLFLALLVIGMGAASALWLKNVNRELQS